MIEERVPVSELKDVCAHCACGIVNALMARCERAETERDQAYAVNVPKAANVRLQRENAQLRKLVEKLTATIAALADAI